MATPITRIEDLNDDFIYIYVPANELPNTYYVNQKWHDYLRMCYGDNIIDFIAFVYKERELPISFDAEHYGDLAEHLKEHFIYDLQQARTIIKWIDEHVSKPTDNFDWGNTYLEILENADGC